MTLLFHMLTAKESFSTVRVRPKANKFIRDFAHKRNLKVVAAIDILIRGWGLLTDAQKQQAFKPKGGGE